MRARAERGASALREDGKLLYLHGGEDEEARGKGIEMLNRAANLGDPEALYILGADMLRGRLRPVDGDRIECAMEFLASASNRGSLQARGMLNRICEERYRNRIRFDPVQPYPLTGFDGELIEIDRKGLFVPVDAKLTFDGQMNILTLCANINFVFLGEEEFDIETYVLSILRGFTDWEGDYEVFGGQKLRVVLELTAKPRLKDSVHVIPVGRTLGANVLQTAEKYASERRVERLRNIITHRRSFVAHMIKNWSVHSTKMMYMQSRSGRFDDEDDLRSTARHEFGHILGLGDLYASEIDELQGVPKNEYDELDSFHLFDRNYHLVMCDADAPVSNNDVEMVVLAFSKNKFQRFQPDRTGTKISEALGKGN